MKQPTLSDIEQTEIGYTDAYEDFPTEKLHAVINRANTKLKKGLNAIVSRNSTHERAELLFTRTRLRAAARVLELRKAKGTPRK